MITPTDLARIRTAAAAAPPLSAAQVARLRGLLAPTTAVTAVVPVELGRAA